MEPVPNPPSGLVLRPIHDGDLGFLAQLYASTRADEMARVPWSEDEKRAFLAMQFEAQHRFYTEQFTQARFEVIELGGEPAGRLYVDRRADEIRVIDVALVPEHRGHGLGTRLLGAVLAEAADAGLPVTLHVEPENPAVRLYGRLGFEVVTEAEGEVYQLMRWDPPRTPS